MVGLGYPAGMSERNEPVVLLVDDDPVITRLLEVNFRQVGYRIGTVSRGDAALERMQARPPDAVVLDVMLPGMGGYDVCRRMRELPALKDIPVIFLSARPEDELPDDAELGPVDHIAKPFEPLELVELVRRRVEERAAK